MHRALSIVAIVASTGCQLRAQFDMPGVGVDGGDALVQDASDAQPIADTEIGAIDLFAPTPSWISQLSGGDSVVGAAIALDDKDNIFVAGTFTDQMQILGAVLTKNPSPGHAVPFIAKVSPLKGLASWVRTTTAVEYDTWAYDVAADTSGDAYVVGSCWGNVQFGAHKLTNCQGLYVTKLSRDGDFKWVRSLTCVSKPQLRAASIAVDSAGSSYVTATCGLPSPNAVLVSKLDSTGNSSWTKQIAFKGQSEAIAVDSAGNSTIAGWFEGSAQFGATPLTAIGTSDLFVARLDPQGTFTWAVGAGGTGRVEAHAVAVDAVGNTVVTGGFAGSVTLGAAQLKSKGDYDVFVAYLSKGAISNGEQAGGKGDDVGLGIAVSGLGEVLVTGRIHGGPGNTVDFGMISTMTTSTDEIFLVKSKIAGGFGTPSTAGGAGDDRGLDVASGRYVLSDRYVMGTFQQTASFAVGDRTCSGSGAAGTTCVNTFVARSYGKL